MGRRDRAGRGNIPRYRIGPTPDVFGRVRRSVPYALTGVVITAWTTVCPDAKPFAIAFVDQCVGFRGIWSLHGHRVPFDALLEPQGKVADEESLGKGTGVGEAGLGVVRLVIFAGLDPFRTMADRAGDGQLGHGEFLAAAFGVESGPAGPAAADEGALVADKVAYMTINATPARWANVEHKKKANQLIKDCVVKYENLDYIDTFDATMGIYGKPRRELLVTDRLHFNADGYKILASRVREHLPKTSAEKRVTRPESVADDSYPRLVTAETRAEPQALAALEKPGKVFFQDDFESPASLKKYLEVRGLKEGHAKLVTDPKLAHSGKGTIQFTAVARDGKEFGAGVSGWFGPDGYDRVYFRRYIKFAVDYDQGNLNHVGGGLAAVAGSNRWRAIGWPASVPVVTTISTALRALAQFGAASLLPATCSCTRIGWI